MNDALIKCPDCGGTEFQKYGVTKAGLQKFRCMRLGCGRQFVAGSERVISSETKEKILKLLSDNVKPKIIHKAFPAEISLRWIFELKRRTKKTA